MCIRDSKNNYHCFQPLLYQVATGSLGADSIAHPFRRTVGPMSNVIYRMGEVLRVVPEGNHVETDHGHVHYDHLILATGTVTNFFGNRQIAEEAMQLKSINQALDIRSDFLQDFEAALYLEDEHKQRQRLNFVIVGGGPSGVELAGALAEIRKTIVKHEYREMHNERMQIHLVDSNHTVLGSFSPKAQQLALKYLKKLGVNVIFGQQVTDYDGETLTFKDGTTMDTNTVIWTAGVKGRPIPGIEGSVEERSGRYRVDAFNRVVGTKNVYALGDIAQNTADPQWPKGHPQIAPVAIQQAKNLAKNLGQKSAVEWKPFGYRDKGSMATIGRYKAVVDAFGMHIGGLFAWLAWMFVHLMALVGFRNRLQVLIGCLSLCCFLMVRRPPRSTLDRSSAASDVYKRQGRAARGRGRRRDHGRLPGEAFGALGDPPPRLREPPAGGRGLSLIHISEPTRPY